LELWGSASVSLNLWWTLWSRHHSKRSFYDKNWNKIWKFFSFYPFIFILFTCPAMEWQMQRNIRNGSLALYERCDHNLWAPAVTPSPRIIIFMTFNWSQSIFFMLSYLPLIHTNNLKINWMKQLKVWQKLLSREKYKTYIKYSVIK
jgi:hypothetical protein